MNYYPFHIGDYLSATRHLSWEEDAAYRRLLDTYYTSEKPLPTDLRAVCRLVLATTDSQRDAVQVVLNEFFELTADGWINGRADAEIASMQEKQESNELRDSHERERQRRYRERRAAMFADLRDVEIVPAWDVSMKELQRLHDEKCNAPATSPTTSPETHLQRVQVVSGNAPATAIPTPTPTPTPNIGESAPKSRPTRSCPQAFFVNGPMREWAKENAPLVDVELATATFRDHTFKTAMTDWEGAWRNWLRKDQQFAEERRRPGAKAMGIDVARLTVPGSPHPDPALEKIRRDAAIAAPLPAQIRERLQLLRPRKEVHHAA